MDQIELPRIPAAESEFTTVLTRRRTHKQLKAISKETGLPLYAILEGAVDRVDETRPSNSLGSHGELVAAIAVLTQAVVILAAEFSDLSAVIMAADYPPPAALEHILREASEVPSKNKIFP